MSNQKKNNLTIKLQGKEYVLFQGLLELAHSDYDLESIESDLLQVPSPDNGNVCIVKAVVKTKSGKTFTGIGDASPQSVNKMIVPHIIRMAETRAIGRALRFLTGFGTLVEELLGVDSATEQHTHEPARQPQHVTQDVSHATYSENEQIPGIDGNVVEIPEQEAPAIIKQLWQIKHGSLDKLHDHFNKQLKLGYSAKNIEANLRKDIKLPQSIADVWFDMYSGDQKMLNHGPAWYLEKRLSGMTDEQIEVGLAEAIAKKQTASAGA